MIGSGGVTADLWH